MNTPRFRSIFSLKDALIAERVLEQMVKDLENSGHKDRDPRKYTQYRLTLGRLRTLRRHMENMQQHDVLHLKRDV